MPGEVKARRGLVSRGSGIGIERGQALCYGRRAPMTAPMEITRMDASKDEKKNGRWWLEASAWLRTLVIAWLELR